MVAVPREAATLVLMRDSAQSGSGIEILMVRRHKGSGFMPGAYVFPGGAIDEADCAPQMEELCHGLSPAEAQGILEEVSSPQKALGFFVATIRETFEEAGILLAYREPPQLITIGEHDRSRFDGYRRQAREAASSFAGIIQEEGLSLAADRLFYFSHWITPEIVPIRFDTRFFVAAAPPHQEAVHDDLETTDSRWISPEEVLEMQKSGRLNVPFPTLCNLQSLVGFSTVEEVIVSTHGKQISAVNLLRGTSGSG